MPAEVPNYLHGCATSKAICATLVIVKVLKVLGCPSGILLDEL